MFLVNGEPSSHVAISDRGLHYGDGLFETIAVAKRQTVFLDRHLKRLQAGCGKLRLPCPDTHLVTREAQYLCGQWESETAVLKLMLTRGSGSRGYRQPDIIAPTRILSLHPFPVYPADYQNDGINMRFCATRLGLNPALAGIKHLNRLEQVLARAEWTDTDIQEGIMLDCQGRIIEGTMSNLFYVKHSKLFTAALTQCGVSGIMRGIIIEQATDQGLDVSEQDFTQAELQNADEIFICNAVIGIWPVRQIGSQSFPIGPLTRQIQSWVNAFRQGALSAA
jgi:4-amino-4-deoxychorismate lyase